MHDSNLAGFLKLCNYWTFVTGGLDIWIKVWICYLCLSLPFSQQIYISKSEIGDEGQKIIFIVLLDSRS